MPNHDTSLILRYHDLARALGLDSQGVIHTPARGHLTYTASLNVTNSPDWQRRILRPIEQDMRGFAGKSALLESWP